MLFEANERLIPTLERSVGRRSRLESSTVEFQVRHAAVADRDELVNFAVNPESSGLSSLDFSGVHEAFERLPVRQIRIDDEVRASATDRLLFKIDIEGAELLALSGMTHLLSSVEAFIGIVEISEENLSRAGSTSEDLWDFCSRVSKLWLFDGGNNLVDLTGLRWCDIDDFANSQGLRISGGADIVMCKDDRDLRGLAPPPVLRYFHSLAKTAPPHRNVCKRRQK